MTLLVLAPQDRSEQTGKLLQQAGMEVADGQAGCMLGLLGPQDISALSQQYPCKAGSLLVLVSPRGRLMAISADAQEIKAALAKAPAASQPAKQ